MSTFALALWSSSFLHSSASSASSALAFFSSEATASSRIHRCFQMSCWPVCGSLTLGVLGLQDSCRRCLRSRQGLRGSTCSRAGRCTQIRVNVALRIIVVIVEIILGLRDGQGAIAHNIERDLCTGSKTFESVRSCHIIAKKHYRSLKSFHQLLVSQSVIVAGLRVLRGSPVLRATPRRPFRTAAGSSKSVLPPPFPMKISKASIHMKVSREQAQSPLINAGPHEPLNKISKACLR